ncbi:ATP-grasp domain-containing protein [Pseudomonas maumuensis]|uniref:Biotin carboxylase n=1 Tax=Pseudomonas maumuensis TaxID=2842354 RepID=A0ABX8NR59_9PSED|nr:biotin carboxylase [Pseudomonas maumuensis]QXH58518.1 biotin carboxylase [Pseudomonas maumuensis]
MQLIVFCPPKIILQHDAASWAAALGEGGLLLSCSSRAREITTHLGEQVAYRLFDNFNDNALVEVDVHELARELTAPLCVALAEIDVLRVARINDRLGVSTGAEGRAMFYRDKFFMKQRTHDRGLKIAEMAPLPHATEALRFSEAHGFPVVVKPRDGRGSNGVEVLRDLAQLRTWLARQPSTTFHNLMIERFVRGSHYIVNGLYIDGKPILVSPVRVMTSALDFLGGKSHDLHMLDAGNPMRDRLVRYARTLVEDVLPSEPTMLFHLELFVDQQDEIVLCEIASRLGGVFFNQEITHAWGLDPRMAFLRALRDPDYRPAAMSEPRQMVGHISIPPRVGLLRDVPTECALDDVLEHRISASRMTTYRSMEFTNSEIFNAIVAGRDERELQLRLAEVERWFHDSCDWAGIEAATPA